MSWHVLLTVLCHDESAVVQLERRGFEAYRPVLQVRPRRKDQVRGGPRFTVVSMFPGYVFVRKPYDVPWLRLAGAPDIHSLLALGGELATLSDAALEEIHQTENYWRVRRSLQTVRMPVQPGATVTVRAGPFFGHIGCIVGLDSKGRVALLLRLLGRATRVAMPVEYLQIGAV